MTEKWKDIQGFEGRYQISTHGNVKSLNFKGTGIPGILKPIIASNGYYTVIFYNHSHAKRLYVHRLVAQAFLKNPDDWKEVNHKDGEKSNNGVRNLEWCTSQYNHLHAIKTGLYDNMLKAVEKQKKPFFGKNLVTGTIKHFSSLSEAAKFTGGNKGNISKALHNGRTHVKGFSFRYAGEGVR